MPESDKRRQSIYLPTEMLHEIEREATRLDRSLSWIVQRAWSIARKGLMKYREDDEEPATQL